MLYHGIEPSEGIENIFLDLVCLWIVSHISPVGHLGVSSRALSSHDDHGTWYGYDMCFSSARCSARPSHPGILRYKVDGFGN